MEIAAIISAVLGPSGIVALLTWLRSRRKPGVERKDADAASADERHQVPMALAQGAMDLATALQRDLAKETKARQSLQAKVDRMEEQAVEQSRTITVLRRAISRIRDWWQTKIVDDWDTVRQHPHPPDFPDIDHLEG